MKPPASLDDDELGTALRGGLRLADAPAPLIAAALELWPQTATAAAPGALATAVSGAVRRLQAVLTFDSWASTPGALGLRSASAPAQTRQLMFNAGDRDIDLRIAAAAGSYVLAGQILGPEERGSIEIRVDTADHPLPSSVALDDFGSFELAALRAGQYSLSLHFASGTIELPPITVGTR